ncbi:MAG TPA: multiheme c-type cytochrome, partial [Thermoguttaceae bacterium]|nr:multiheme c-type cytochrome [Thermoguttaceae bacterium]
MARSSSYSWSIVVHLVAVAALTAFTTGCPSSSEETDVSETPATKITGPPVERSADPQTPAPETSDDQQSLQPIQPPEVPTDSVAAAANLPAEPADPFVLPPSDFPTEPAMPTAAEPSVTPVPVTTVPVTEVPMTEVPEDNPLREPGLPLEPSQSPSDLQEPPVEQPPAEDLPVVHSVAEPEEPEEEPFDPIKENGPIFVDWPKPSMALIITGRQEGYIEPCGCAGLDRMKGGMSRRHTMFEELRAKGWPVLGIDLGGQAKGYGRQAEMKFHIMVEGMRQMDYAAIGLGETDLRLPAGELLSDVANADIVQSPFLSANVALFGFDAQLTTRARVITAEGKRFGITSVLGEKARQEIRNDEIETIDPVTALTTVVPDLKSRSDYLILLAHSSRDEAIELAKKFPDFHLIVTSALGAEPPATYSTLNGGKTVLVEVGTKGMDAIVLGLYADPQNPIRYQRVPLDSRFAASREMKMLMEAYQEQLKAAGFVESEIRAVPHPLSELGGKFVGSRACESCHEASNDVWKRSGHAKAYDTLANLDEPRQFDPECISCHVIGWNPQKYFPYESGYRSIEKTPHLIDVGCESCHGPGGAHCKAEEGSDLALQKRLQEALVVTKEDAKPLCLTCHDLDNSPDFDFDTYWPKVE